MDYFENDIKFSLYGYDTESVDEIIREKNRRIDVQERDVESLKREICALKEKLSNSENKKK